MRRALLILALSWPMLAQAQTVEAPLITVDRIVGAVGLPATFTSNASRRNINPNSDAYLFPSLSIQVSGKLSTWQYTLSSAGIPEFYNRYDDLDNAIALASVQGSRRPLQTLP
jgi:hypothetical protein